MIQRPTPKKRNEFNNFCPITTRWMDNDAYLHVNNVAYYSFFDTAVNEYLIQGGVLDIRRSTVTGLVAHSECSYFSPVAFPEAIQVGLRVARLGKSSVTYELGVFRDDAESASAQGRFVHVYVDRQTSRPVVIPDDMRSLLERLIIDRDGTC
ncbi:acyl-CoA thioester hydrolase [Roseovarius azorensis]|uniref:Acyl-CoA thioester hydrolase n=1 Tax=Roseovarius azorensis TaxID=1287727 RepID=A0A1H7XND8_9RHOB|nr:thioesterase family protein [Roseovarius azorensis]SEM35286.1 acyl-CoA thioester hydrolase [Roseovarius azorensis]